MFKKNETTKLPFSHKLFYLDVTTNLTLKTKIEFCVKQLGGTVETFLDRKVRYVVTDKPSKDWPASNKDKQPPPTPDASKQQLTGQSGGVSRSVEANKDVSKLEFMGLTRGKLLATKTPQSSSNKTKDVLETAVKLNMKILTHRSILDFCKKYIKISLDDLACDQSNEQDNATANSNTKVRVKPLKAPFLKFEDKEEKFAPAYKEFEVWPSVCGDSNSSSLVTTNNQQHQTPTVPKNFNTKLIQPLQAQKKRQRVLFCEICSKEFTNMIEHVKTDQHQIYMNNYKELRSVIDSLPNWITLNDTSAFDENEEFTDEESEFEDEFSDEYDEDGYSSESKETVLSEEEMNKANSEHFVPPSIVTPVKVFKLNNIFNNISE